MTVSCYMTTIEVKFLIFETVTLVLVKIQHLENEMYRGTVFMGFYDFSNIYFMVFA